jgi:hypothetical protein
MDPLPRSRGLVTDQKKNGVKKRKKGASFYTASGPSIIKTLKFVDPF